MDLDGREWVEEEDPREYVAVSGLLELSRGFRDMWQFRAWGSKKKRSRQFAGGEDSNCDDLVKEPKQEEAEQGFRLKRIRVIVAEETGTRKNRVPEDGKKERRSPTSPLSWNERGSGSTGGGGSGGGSGDRFDTATQAERRLLSPAAPPAAPPCDRPLGHPGAFKDEIGDKVHNPSSRRGTKKKTIAELKEQVNELSLEQEELKKEKKQRLELLQSLRDANELCKAQIALCGQKGEAKPSAPPEVSADLAEETKGPALLKSSLGHVELECSENLDVNSPLVQVMDGTSSIAEILPPHHINMNNSETEVVLVVKESPSGHFNIPDLNIPLPLEDSPVQIEDSNILVQMEDSSDNSSSGCDEQVPQLNRAVVAAEARKHRKECLRVKSSQFGKSRFR